MSGRFALNLANAVAPATLACVILEPESQHRHRCAALLKEGLLKLRVTVVDPIPESMALS